MNWSQLKTVIWLRWRLTRNQAARAGAVSMVITIIAVIVALLIAIGAGVGGFFGGYLLLSKASPLMMMVTWDAIVAVFIFAWLLGVLAEIQRSETIDLGKLFHLPISLNEIFFINYIASHVTLSLIVFVPGALGLCAGLFFAGNGWMALLVPLVLSFIFMVTAWTYCLRGWLVALMVNPRRRRNVVVGITLAIVLIAQLPNLYINVIVRPGQRHGQQTRHRARKNQNDDSQDEKDQQGQTFDDFIKANIPEPWMMAHDYVPFLWLPKGAMALADNDALPAILGIAGFILCGVLGLARAYRSTVRFYLGVGNSGATQTSIAPAVSGKPIKNFLEKRVPFVSEDIAALALAFFRSMMRAPEVKMALFSNLLVLVALSPVVLMNSRGHMSETTKLFMATAVVGMTFFGLLMQMFNLFGFDREGFRSLVLSPVLRKKILIAKNLSLAPIAVCMGAIFLLAVTVLEDLPTLVVLASFCKLGAMFFFMSVIGNLISVWVPYRVTAGSLKPTKPPAKTFILIFLSQLLFPIAMLPNFIPPLIGFLLEKFGGWPAQIIDLMLSAGVLTIAAVIYWLSIDSLGELLQKREQAILLVVSREVE